MARSARLLVVLIALALPARAAATPPTADQIVARAQALHVGAQADRLRSRFLPGVRLLHGGKDMPGSTRLGGKPDLARTATWPSCHKHKLGFIMQVNVADLGGGDHGTLSIFGDLRADSEGYGPLLNFSGKVGCLVQVRFTRGATAPRAIPKGVTKLRSTPLQPRPTLTVPNDDAAQHFLGRQTSEAFIGGWPELADEAAWGVLGKETPEQPIHQLLGWSSPIQEDPTIHAPCKGDVSLVQVDYDDQAGFHMGDSGVLYLDIAPADLAAHRYTALCGELQDD